ncbi:MAG: pyridoxamine 5'-phosphate oxidase family protein [Dehalococcoidales bacterium]|nr:pyridoxamine 5'-phosphate oxidase family protein [Dehalococcoidales bacterium]
MAGQEGMKEVYEFLKKCGTYYLATVDGDQPRVRPFGTIHMFENKLYIQTGKKKDVSKQMKKNPKIEICGMAEGKWIRVQAIAVNDDRVEAKQSMLDAYPQLKGMYSATDDNTQVLYLKDVVATINSFGAPPKVVKF